MSHDQGSKFEASRRNFLKAAGGAAAFAAFAGSAVVVDAAPQPGGAGSTILRNLSAVNLKDGAARNEFNTFAYNHPSNGDESLYSTKIASYSKGLPHNSFGEVDLSAWKGFIQTLNSGNPAAFEQLALGGDVPLVDPQSGLAFDLEGQDGHGLVEEPPPALASAEEAGEAVELYWAALLRDVPFADYDSDSGVAAACADLNKLSDFRGPRIGGKVTPGTLFRGFTAGDLVGPYFSQFLVQPLQFGAVPIDQRIKTFVAGQDYMTDFPSFLATQNGAINYPFTAPTFDSTHRYLRNGRDIAAWVHVDILYQAYLFACIYLVDINAPLNAGNPYLHSKTQSGFGTFGIPHIKALLAEVADRALKAVWYQKWFVHRRLRPEEFGGLAHLTLSNERTYPLHPDLLNSDAMDAVHITYNSWLLPQAFPEGCPQHPSYGAGHATVAGACVTVLKAFFNENFVLPSPVMASDDGLSLVPYTGSDAGQITVGGELNKVAANIAIGRNLAGVHWRSDYQQSLLLGEALAITILRDQKPTYNENFNGFTFTKFDGTTITV
ncbi:MAG TPA: vanadium-dependent haloperoxidase [Candidatus Binataceae bacterium]|nr:vanadium-dependent haloperoxidase [Candidatus Binataceae bacterium]